MRRGKSRTNLKYSGPCYYVGHSGTAHTASLYTLANKSYCVEGCVILLPSFPRLLFHPRNLRGGIHATLATITLFITACLNFRGFRFASRSKLPQPARSAIFAKIGGNSRNLAGIILHHSVIHSELELWSYQIFGTNRSMPDSFPFRRWRRLRRWRRRVVALFGGAES